jgi:hypothetical protein
MTEPLIIGIVLALAAFGAVAWAYRGFVARRARFLAHLRQTAPEITVRRLTEVGLVAGVLGSDVAVDLVTLGRRRPRGMPEPAWFDQVLDGIRSQVPVPQAPPYALVMDRVLPLLKPAAYAALFERYPRALQLAWRAFSDEVVVTYVVAGRHERTLVTISTLEAWQVSPEALHTQAVANLRAQTLHLLEEIGGRRARYEHLDGVEATRILVADLMVPPEVTDPVIAIPEETVLLIEPARERKTLAAEAAARHAASGRPISPRLFRPSPGGPVAVVEDRVKSEGN